MRGGLCGGGTFHGPMCVCWDFRVCREQIACVLPYCVAAAAEQERRGERFPLLIRTGQRPNYTPSLSSLYAPIGRQLTHRDSE